MTALGTQIGGSHYTSCGIQPVEYIEKNKLGFLEGNVVKRITRHDKPTGKGVQDIDKAIHELQLLKEFRYPSPKVPVGQPTPAYKTRLNGLPVPLGTRPEVIAAAFDWITLGHCSPYLRKAVQDLVTSQAKLVYELKKGESAVHIVAPSYEQAQSCARNRGWPTWIYHSNSDLGNLRGYRERVVVYYNLGKTPFGANMLAPRNTILILD